MNQDTHTIDASGKALGRVASEAAKALMGKMRSDYVPHAPKSVKVTINNASKIKMSEKKLRSTTFQRYSGYPGGHRTETYEGLSSRRGVSAAVVASITRMLPRNTLRVQRLKNLTVNA